MLPKKKYQELIRKKEDQPPEMPQFDQLLAYLPPEQRDLAKTILNHLIQTRRFQYEPSSGCIHIDHTPIPGSNLCELLYSMTKCPVTSKNFDDDVCGTNSLLYLLATTAFPGVLLTNGRHRCKMSLFREGWSCGELFYR